MKKLNRVRYLPESDHSCNSEYYHQPGSSPQSGDQPQSLSIKPKTIGLQCKLYHCLFILYFVPVSSRSYTGSHSWRSWQLKIYIWRQSSYSESATLHKLAKMYTNALCRSCNGAVPMIIQIFNPFFGNWGSCHKKCIF